MAGVQTNRKWWTLGAVCVATFMLLLDITVVNTALPKIQQDLGGSFSDLQWVIDAYALSLAALVLTAGSLADRLGRRRVFVAGLAIFSVASLLCALAPDPTFLNLARGLQGVGGAIMFAVSLALVAQEFPGGPERGMAMGIYGASIGVSVAVGPLIGGVLTDGLGWQSVFLVNVPVGIATIAVTYWKLRESRDPNASRIDWGGVVTFSAALLLLVFALVRGNDEGWGSTAIVSLLAAAAVLMAAFVAIERRVAEPMLPLGLFRRGAFTGVQLAAFAISASMFSLFLYLTLYLQNFLGYSAIGAGLRYLPITVGAFILAPISGMALAKVQARYLMAAGLGLAGIGLLLMGGLELTSGWTALLARLHRRRDRRRAGQPGDRRRRPQRRAERAQRHGGGDQRHLPPGRRRRRHRGLGSDLPRRRRLEDGVAGGRRGRPRPGPRAGRSDLLGRAAAGARTRSRRAPATRSATRPKKGSSTASTRSSCSAGSSAWSAPAWPSGWCARRRSTAARSAPDPTPPSRPTPSPSRADPAPARSQFAAAITDCERILANGRARRRGRLGCGACDWSLMTPGTVGARGWLSTGGSSMPGRRSANRTGAACAS